MLPAINGHEHVVDGRVVRTFFYNKEHDLDDELKGLFKSELLVYVRIVLYCIVLFYSLVTNYSLEWTYYNVRP